MDRFHRNELINCSVTDHSPLFPVQTGTRTRTCRPWTAATALGSRSRCWCCAWPRRTAWRARCCAGEGKEGTLLKQVWVCRQFEGWATSLEDKMLRR